MFNVFTFLSNSWYIDLTAFCTSLLFLYFVRSKLICPWGSEGAIAIDNDTDELYSVSAYPPSKVVDSLGAGDTFVASTIYCLCKGESLQESVDFGCKVAGAKIGFNGYDEISLLIQNNTFP